MNAVKEAIGKDFVVRITSEANGAWTTPIAMSEADADRLVSTLTEKVRSNTNAQGKPQWRSANTVA